MDKLEKVELVREKCGVTYEDARAALEANDYDVLDAIIWLEQQGKTQNQTASYETGATTARVVSPEMAQAQEEYQAHSRRSRFGEASGRFFQQLRSLFRAGLDMTFIAERHGAVVVSLPLLFVVIGLLAWGASLWLLIVGLFFGFRYRVEGASPVTFDVNDAMSRAADVAESIKDDLQGKDE